MTSRGEWQCSEGGRVHSFGASCPLAPFRSLLGGTNRDSVARSVARPLTPSSNKPKPKWGSKPHLRSLWLHSISPLISDPPHKLLSGREERERARDMKRSSTLLVTPSPTARARGEGGRGRAGEHVCQMDGWRRREKGCNDGSGVVRSTAKNEPHRSLDRVAQRLKRG